MQVEYVVQHVKDSHREISSNTLQIEIYNELVEAIPSKNGDFK